MCQCRKKTEARLRAILAKVLGCKDRSNPRRWLNLLADDVFWEHVEDVLVGTERATEETNHKAMPLFETPKELVEAV